MRAVLAALVLLAAGTIAGCESYAETRTCQNGTVFDENGDCVLPPVPDGGVSIETCAELCAMIPDWTAEQVECLQGNLSLAGPLPTECAVLATTADCEACVGAVGATDLQCGLSRSCL